MEPVAGTLGHAAGTPGDVDMATWEPRIVTILCNWCTYGAADLAGVNRLQYPTNFKVIRVPCTGRISPKMILAAFRSGADGVWVSGCHPGDCHYISGNFYARRRFTMLRALLGHIGIDERRLHFSWISAAEGPKFAATAREVIAAVKQAGPAHQLIKTKAQVI